MSDSAKDFREFQDLKVRFQEILASVEERSKKPPTSVSVSDAYRQVTYALFGAGAVFLAVALYYFLLPLIGPIVDYVTGNHTSNHFLRAPMLGLIGFGVLGVAIYRHGRPEGRSFQQSFLVAFWSAAYSEWFTPISVGLFVLYFVLAFAFS